MGPVKYVEKGVLSLLLSLIVDIKCCYSELNGPFGQQAVIWMKAAMKMPSPNWILNASGGENDQHALKDFRYQSYVNLNPITLLRRLNRGIHFSVVLF